MSREGTSPIPDKAVSPADGARQGRLLPPGAVLSCERAASLKQLHARTHVRS